MKKPFVFSVVALLFAGCAHNLEFENLHRYRTGIRDDFSKRGLRAYVVCENHDYHSQILCENIENQIARRGGYAVQKSPETSEGPADVEVYMSVTTKASGRASNFFVSWPGFVVFAHAWLGYGYDVEYLVKCRIVDPVSKKSISEFTEPLHLGMRHAEFDRTWAAGCGWLFLYTATAFVNGFYVTTYDEDITPLLYNEAYPVIAGRVAKKVVTEINASSVRAGSRVFPGASQRAVPKAAEKMYTVESFERITGSDFSYSFCLRMKDGADAGLSALDRIKDEIRGTVAADYAGAYGGDIREVHVDLPEFRLKEDVIRGRADVMRISVVSLTFNPQAQKGVIAVRIGANRFEDARAWVRKNIESLARDKNVALTTGQIPPAARFYLGAERVKDGNVLEIEFETE